MRLCPHTQRPGKQFVLKGSSSKRSPSPRTNGPWSLLESLRLGQVIKARPEAQKMGQKPCPMNGASRNRPAKQEAGLVPRPYMIGQSALNPSYLRSGLAGGLGGLGLVGGAVEGRRRAA